MKLSPRHTDLLHAATRHRAYMLLDIRPGFVDQAQQRLLTAPGVVSADVVDGPPDLIVVTEAAIFEELVRQTIDALIAVEDFTKAVRCLSVRMPVVERALKERNGSHPR